MTIFSKAIHSTLVAIPLMFAISSNSGAAFASQMPMKNFGGVNFDRYCKKKFGPTFKARALDHLAEGWVCEQSRKNRRPINVLAACKSQYGRSVYIAMPTNSGDPYSWTCLRNFRRPNPPKLRSVDGSAWCVHKFGKNYHAKVESQPSNGWTCEKSLTDRRPLDITAACKFIYGARIAKARYLKENDTQTVECILKHRMIIRDDSRPIKRQRNQ